MPTEKKRQRQRVRHEAGDADCGDSVSAGNAGKKLTENCGTIFNSESAGMKVQLAEEEYAKSSHEKNIDGKQVQRGKEYQYSGRQDYNKSYRGRDNHAQGNKGGRNRGHERRNYSGAPAVPVIQCNIAYAEEREYEPVTIMESSTTKEETTPFEKYRRREVVSNWLQYNEIPSDEEIQDGEDYLRGQDFSEILQLNASSGTGGYLHLKGEMSWGDVDTSYLSSHGLGALKITDLVSALNTIPLQTQLDIPEKMLPVHTLSYYTELAKDNAKLYKPNAEYVTDIEVNEKILESLKITSDDLILTVEEPKNESKNPIDATLKFSSAFAPQPDDIDLDDLLKGSNSESSSREGTPAVSVETLPKEKEIPSTKNLKQEAPKKDFSNKNMKKENKPESPAFNFGLPTNKKEDNSTKSFNVSLSAVDTVKAKETKLTHSDSNIIVPVKNEESSNEDKGPTIDLDAPVTQSSKPVQLVSKTEAENLEDWLDSVLED